jgi:hypothetical protein
VVLDCLVATGEKSAYSRFIELRTGWRDYHHVWPNLQWPKCLASQWVSLKAADFQWQLASCAAVQVNGDTSAFVIAIKWQQVGKLAGVTIIDDLRGHATRFDNDAKRGEGIRSQGLEL